MQGCKQQGKPKCLPPSSGDVSRPALPPLLLVMPIGV